jgi:hypothetical protein
MSLSTTISEANYADEHKVLLYKLVRVKGSPCIKEVWGKRDSRFGDAEDFYTVDGWTVLVGRSIQQSTYTFFEYNVAMEKLKFVLLQELKDLKRKIQNANEQLETVQEYLAALEAEELQTPA